MITAGCLVWGVMTLGFSVSRSLREAIFFWAINGLGLSLVIPNVQVRAGDCSSPVLALLLPQSRAAMCCTDCAERCGWQQGAVAVQRTICDGSKPPWQAPGGLGMTAHRLCEATLAPCAECDSRFLQRRG